MNDRILSFLGICRRAKKLVIGAESVVQSAQNGSSRLIVYASDFSKNSLKPVLKTAKECGVNAVMLNRTKEELSFAVGRLCGVASVDDNGFAAKLMQMIEAENTGN